MTMLRPNFHMRQPSLFGLTSQTCEKFACQVGITASQTNESWPKTTYGHTRIHTDTHSSTPPAGDGILQIPSHSSCGSRWRNQCAVFTPCGFGQNRQNLATATGGESHSTLPRPSPLHPSDLQLIILNKIEFAPLDCCKIIKHGTGLLNRWAGYGSVLLRFSFVGFGNNFVLRPCQVCRGFVPSTFPPRCTTPGCRIYNSIKLFASTFCARPAMANCNSFAIMRQLQSEFPDNGFTWGTLLGLAIGK